MRRVSESSRFSVVTDAAGAGMNILRCKDACPKDGRAARKPTPPVLFSVQDLYAVHLGIIRAGLCKGDDNLSRRIRNCGELLDDGFVARAGGGKDVKGREYARAIDGHVEFPLPRRGPGQLREMQPHGVVTPRGQPGDRVAEGRRPAAALA